MRTRLTRSWYLMHFIEKIHAAERTPYAQDWSR